MPFGFFTIEQWRKKRWLTVCHVRGYQKLTDAIRELERRNKSPCQNEEWARCFLAGSWQGATKEHSRSAL